MRHSERGNFNSCPYKYHLQRIGLRRIEESSKEEDKNFGIAVHAGLKAHYDGKEWSEIFKVYQDLYPEKEYKNKAKDFEGGKLLLMEYRDYWREQDKLWDIIGTEVEDQVEFNDEEHDLHIDLLAKNRQTSEIWAWDHKTTDKTLGKGYWKKYELDAQITRYTKYIKDKYGSCGGFIINAMQVGHRQRVYKGEPAGYYQNFERQPFSRNEAQIKFWMDSEKDWQALIEHCETMGTWPKHLSALCGWCEYYELCMSADNQAVRDTIYTTDPVSEPMEIIDETK